MDISELGGSDFSTPKFDDVVIGKKTRVICVVD